MAAIAMRDRSFETTMIDNHVNKVELICNVIKIASYVVPVILGVAYVSLGAMVFIPSVTFASIIKMGIGVLAFKYALIPACTIALLYFAGKSNIKITEIFKNAAREGDSEIVRRILSFESGGQITLSDGVKNEARFQARQHFHYDIADLI